MRLTRLLPFISIVIALTAGAYWLGFREGVRVGVMVDSVPRGGISLFQLNKIKQGVSANTVTLLESDIDLGLLWAHQIEQHPLKPLLDPLWDLQVSEQSITRLATYRATHPSPLRSEAVKVEEPPNTPEALALRQELLDGAKMNEQVIALMVKKYAVQPQK